MTSRQYQTKNGVTQYKPVLSEEEMREAMSDNMAGFCLACGAEVSGVEPDARRYVCEDCGTRKVYGLEELLMMGLLEIE